MPTRTHAEPKQATATSTVAPLGRAVSRERHRAGSAPVPPFVHDVVRGPGLALDGGTRAFMESRLGHDFGQVRVHADSRAADSARAIDARAYTVGHDIVFGAGQYAPGTSHGVRLMAHELAHVAQQRESSGDHAADAEARAHDAAARVTSGEPVTSGAIGHAPVGLHAEDGQGTEATETSPAPGRTPLVGPLKISSWLVDELIKNGQLSPEMFQLILSGQIEVQPDEKTEPGAGGETGGPSAGGTKGIATEYNALPGRLFGAGLPSLGPSLTDPLAGAQATPTIPSPTQLIPVGGYLDPVIGYIPRHTVKWTPSPSATEATPGAPEAAPTPTWIQRSLADLKTSFDFSEGLTITSKSQPGMSTSIFVTGITHRVKAPGGIGVQTEFGWDKSIGLQLSYKNWFLHGTLDTDHRWGLSLSFPNDSPIPITPWIGDIFREGGIAIEGFASAAAAGPPDLQNLDPLITQLSPHVDRMKGAIDAATGIAKVQPGVNFALTIGSGPRPGATPADKPSGIFFGGAIVGAF